MKKLLIALVSGGTFLWAGLSVADSHESGEMEIKPATPIEMFACKYNEGKGPDDHDAAVEKFNKWADKNDLNDYSAWRLVPYYAGPKQEFDTIWLGSSPSSASMGRAQDTWLATGTDVQAEFNEVSTCNEHAQFAVLQFKEPPKRENPSNIVVSFADCKMSEGTTFDDMAPALAEWGKYRSEHGSTSGIWVFFPAYGGGGEEFDFKYVAAWQNLEDQGKDWDQYSESGWQKAGELFEGKVNCDSSRVYLAKNLRMAEDDDE